MFWVHLVPPKVLLATFGALLLLTVATVGITLVDLGPLNTPAALFIAVLKGSLVYQRPDRLEKNVLAPYDERTVIAGDSVTIEHRTLKQTRRFSLASSAAISAFVASIRAPLAGDRAALERHYSVGLEGRQESWTLTLTPRDPKLASLVKRIQIGGAAERLRRIDVEEATGDRSVMLVSPEPS